MVHYDPAIREADLSGVSLLTSFPSAPAVLEIDAICDRLEEMYA